MSQPQVPKDTVRKFLDVEETELLLEIGRARSQGPALRAPDVLIEDVKEYLHTISGKLRELICHRADLLNLPEFELAVGVAETLANAFSIPLAGILGAYIAKRGIKELCPESENDD